METDLTELLVKHRFFANLKHNDVSKLAACGALLECEPATLLAAEGTNADRFYALIQGRVAIETNVPGRPPITLQTVESGDIIGWSWIDAQDWVFDVRTLTDCTFVALHADKLVKVLSSNTELGFEIMRRLNRVATQRLHAARLQLLDIYGKGTRGE